MKTKKLLFCILSFILAIVITFSLSACSSDGGDDNNSGGAGGGNGSDVIGGLGYGNIFENNDEFTNFTENEFIKASEQPVSYFSMDVSTASYAVVRNYINKGLTLNKDMVKIEEMLNYFKYAYPQPTGGAPLSMSGNIFPCPWNNASMLFSVGLKAKDIEFENVRNNLVFLIDSSGSMDADDRLGLLQEAFCILADNLNDNDIVSIVTYAGNSRTLLSGESGSEKMRIKNIVTDIVAGGSTAGEGGIRQAYNLAEQYFIEGGNNRVILATDGDFNVGISSQSELKDFISQKSSQSKGVYLSVMGFGLGNLKNSTMDTLAQNGNGTAYYIDSILEAKKVMAEEMKGTLVTVADDVKAGVEFNPDKIDSYRLLGYETKLLSHEDWENNQADAGEIGAGHTVTAVYEIKLTATAGNTSANADFGNSFVKASVRYKEPYAGERPSADNREVKEISKLFGQESVLSGNEFLQNEDLVFISAVVESALIFRDSKYKANASIASVILRLNNLGSVASDVYRADFLSLLKKYDLQTI